MGEAQNEEIVEAITEAIDSAHVVTQSDVWVDTDDLPEALRAVSAVTDSALYKPEVYAGSLESSVSKVCLRL